MIETLKHLLRIANTAVPDASPMSGATGETGRPEETGEALTGDDVPADEGALPGEDPPGENPVLAKNDEPLPDDRQPGANDGAIIDEPHAGEQAQVPLPASTGALQDEPTADVTLLLEGTFPYVAGGVSSWVNQVIRGFPDLRFAVVFIGSRPEDYGEMKYSLPENVVALETHYLFSDNAPPPVRAVRSDAESMSRLSCMHECFRAGADAPEEWLANVVNDCRPGGKLDQEVFLHSRASWDYITEMFRTHCTDPSFTDYFWTVRTIHAPLWRLVRIAMNCPTGRVYHAVSTGYAGFLGALLKLQHQRPLILSEHGIYTKERRIDLYQAQWVAGNTNGFERELGEISHFRRMWIRFFEALGRITYNTADHIIALYEANRQRQINDGAPVERTRNIPNGIDVERFAPLRSQRTQQVPQVFCLIGRVVPIKDIKTFIRAARVVISRLPEAEAWIAGPDDEDHAYANECRQLAQNLGLGDKVRFLGHQQMTELLPRVGVVVLSSISEALPLVLLEGYAAGVPAVTTDVGSCRQLIYGLTPEDQALGASGHVVSIADPQALADRVHHLLTDRESWQKASAAAIARVETYYTQQMMFDNYRSIYEKSLSWQASVSN